MQSSKRVLGRRGGVRALGGKLGRTSTNQSLHVDCVDILFVYIFNALVNSCIPLKTGDAALIGELMGSVMRMEYTKM